MEAMLSTLHNTHVPPPVCPPSECRAGRGSGKHPYVPRRLFQERAYDGTLRAPVRSGETDGTAPPPTAQWLWAAQLQQAVPLTLQMLLLVAPSLCSRTSGTGTRTSGRCKYSCNSRSRQRWPSTLQRAREGRGTGHWDDVAREGPCAEEATLKQEQPPTARGHSGDSGTCPPIVGCRWSSVLPLFRHSRYYHGSS